MPKSDLAALRKRIDEIDQQLVTLLNERAGVATEIGKAKGSTPVYDPVREAEVIRGIISRNNGPLKDDDLVAIFEKIIAACRAIQQERR